MPLPPFLTLLLCLLSVAYASASYVTLTTTNQTSNATTSTLLLPVVFTTLGNSPTSFSAFNVSLVTNPTCKMEDIRGKIVVFVGDILPMFSGCNTSPQAKISTFARVVQEYGGIALVVDNPDNKLLSGRVTGFSSKITIPILVMSSSTKKTLQSPDLSVLSAALPERSSEDADKVSMLRTVWRFMQYFSAILYFLLVLLVSYLFVKELQMYLKKERIVTLSLIMRGVAVYGCIVSVIWCTVDPLGLQGRLTYKDTVVINLQYSAMITIYAMILLMWLQAVGDKRLNKKIRISKIFYGVCAVVFILAITFGILWDNLTTNHVYAYIVISLFVLLCIGFCVVGKGMLQVLYKGRSLSGSNIGLIAKLTIFIGWYFCICLIVVILYVVGTLGQILQLMVTIIGEALVLTGTFVALFFQPFGKPNPSSRKGSTSSRNSNKASSDSAEIKMDKNYAIPPRELSTSDSSLLPTSSSSSPMISSPPV